MQLSPGQLVPFYCLATLALAAGGASGADAFDVWARGNQRGAEQQVAPFFGSQSRTAGPMPTRATAGQFANVPGAFLQNFGLFVQGPANRRKLASLTRREESLLRPAEVKAFDVLMSDNGFGIPVAVVGLRESRLTAQVGATNQRVPISPRVPASLPVTVGQVWVSRGGSSFYPPAPRSPFDRVYYPPIPAGGVIRTPTSLPAASGPGLLGNKAPWDRPRLVDPGKLSLPGTLPARTSPPRYRLSR